MSDEEIFDMEAILREQMPEGTADALLESYTDPGYGEGDNCERCGAHVQEWMQSEHSLWHRNLTLSIKTIQGFMLAHLHNSHDVPLEELA